MRVYRNSADLTLGVLLIAVLVMAQIGLIIARLQGVSMREGSGLVAIGMYLCYVAGILIASYYHKEASFLFRWLVPACARVAGSQSDLAVIGFGIFAALAGLAAIIAGLF